MTAYVTLTAHVTAHVTAYVTVHVTLTAYCPRIVRSPLQSAIGIINHVATKCTGISCLIIQGVENWERDGGSRDGARDCHQYVPEDAFLSELHDKEAQYLRSSSLERYNEQNTGVNASVPKGMILCDSVKELLCDANNVTLAKRL